MFVLHAEVNTTQNDRTDVLSELLSHVEVLTSVSLCSDSHKANQRDAPLLVLWVQPSYSSKSLLQRSSQPATPEVRAFRSVGRECKHLLHRHINCNLQWQRLNKLHSEATQLFSCALQCCILHVKFTLYMPVESMICLSYCHQQSLL